MAARLLRRAKASGGRTLPSSAFSAPPAPQRTLRSSFSLALAGVARFPAGADTADPSRPCSRPFPPCAGSPGTWRSPVLPRPPCGTGQRQDGASPLWDCPRTVLRAVALSSHQPSPCLRRLWGTKACLSTPGTSVVSAPECAPCSFLALPPTRQISAVKTFRCKAAQQLELQS